MDLDESLRYLGLFGRYQKLLISYIAIFSTSFPAALTMMMVFITAEPDMFNCNPPSGISAWNYTVPENDDNGSTINPEKTSGCHTYEVHDGIVGTNQTKCLNGWEYSFERGETSIVAEFDLVCDRKLLKEAAITTYMVGLLVGALPLGQISDIFGRKIVLFMSVLLLGATSTGLALIYNYYAFVVLFFLAAVFRQGLSLCGFVLIIEMSPPENRAFVGTIDNVAWGVGAVMLAPVAYFIPNWRHLQLVFSIGILAGLPFWGVIHESVRWLLSQNRLKKAEEILHKIAKFNHMSAPKTFANVQEVQLLEHRTDLKPIDNCKEPQTAYEIEEPVYKGNVKKLTLIDLFKNPNLAKNTLILVLDWMAANITYYGLSLNSVNLAGNKYLNYFLLSLVEIPAYIIAYITMEYFGGRRLSICLSLLVAGIFCVITAWIPPSTASETDLTTAITTFAMLGKFAISYSWGVVVVYTPEVVPTGLRTTANGLLSSLSRISGIVAPFVIRLNDVSRYLPLNIFGIASIVAGLLSFLLPETRHVPLPETIEDGETIGKRDIQSK